MRRPVTGSCNFATLDSQWQHLSVLEYFYNRVDSIERMKESRSVMPDSLQLHGLYSSWNSLGQNTWVGSLSLLQGIFPTQGSNPGLLHCRRILSQLSHQRSPRILEWVAYLFSSGSSWPRNRTGSPALQTDSLWTELSGKPIERLVYFKFYRKLGDHLEFHHTDICLLFIYTIFPEKGCFEGLMKLCLTKNWCLEIILKDTLSVFHTLARREVGLFGLQVTEAMAIERKLHMMGQEHWFSWNQQQPWIQCTFPLLMATHSSILAWKIPWTDSLTGYSLWHDLANKFSYHVCSHTSTDWFPLFSLWRGRQHSIAELIWYKSLKDKDRLAVPSLNSQKRECE